MLRSINSKNVLIKITDPSIEILTDHKWIRQAYITGLILIRMWREG